MLRLPSSSRVGGGEVKLFDPEFCGSQVSHLRLHLVDVRSNRPRVVLPVVFAPNAPIPPLPWLRGPQWHKRIQMQAPAPASACYLVSVGALVHLPDLARDCLKSGALPLHGSAYFSFWLAKRDRGQIWSCLPVVAMRWASRLERSTPFPLLHMCAVSCQCIQVP